jgi:hypothetical protein
VGDLRAGGQPLRGLVRDPARAARRRGGAVPSRLAPRLVSRRAPRTRSRIGNRSLHEVAGGAWILCHRSRSISCHAPRGRAHDERWPPFPRGRAPSPGARWRGRSGRARHHPRIPRAPGAGLAGERPGCQPRPCPRGAQPMEPGGGLATLGAAVSRRPAGWGTRPLAPSTAARDPDGRGGTPATHALAHRAPSPSIPSAHGSRALWGRSWAGRATREPAGAACAATRERGRRWSMVASRASTPGVMTAATGASVFTAMPSP